MCHPVCVLYGLQADCASKNHYWVPALPPNITHLYLDRNYVSEISVTSLRDYDQLEELDLGMQWVPLVVRNNAFVRQRKLRRLVLGLNINLQLEPRAFVGLFAVQVLYLDACNFTESILTESYMEPLLSLEMLDLSLNKIERLRPGPFFSKLTNFMQLKLKLNQIERICEDDLVSFRGKSFKLMDLHSNKLTKMFDNGYDQGSCGNPFRGVAFDTLVISSNGFSMNTAKQFFKAIDGTPIRQLVFSGHIGKGFSHNNFPDPDENTFKGLTNSSVDILDLSKNYIFALQKAVFSPFQNATIIDISINKINQINPNAFHGLQGNLRMLNLSSNLLGEVRWYMFINLTELRVLDLSNNHIGVLGFDAFSELTKLRALFLTGNSLRDLGHSAALPSLERLYLGDNKLRSLHRITEIARQSSIVDIRENRLTDLEDVYTIVNSFKHLKILFYGGNVIKWCTPDVSFPYNISLQVLDLHDSSLQIIWAQGKCLNLFDRLNNLLAVNVSFNSLATLPPQIFSGLSKVLEIDLSYNVLTYLPPNVFPASLKRLDLSNNFLASPDPTSFLSLFFLNLAGNRFHCDCTLGVFLNWLTVTDVTLLGMAEEYRCEFPAALHNRSLTDYFTIIEPCEDDEKASEEVRFVLFIVSALFIVSVTISGIVYARFRGSIFVVYKRIMGRVLDGPTPTPPVDEGQYDAFFCFSNNDYKWVETALLKKLDNQFSEKNIFHCCFESRDFLPGEDHLANIRDAIWSSRKTVCIVSKEFLKGTGFLILLSPVTDDNP